MPKETTSTRVSFTLNLGISRDRCRADLTLSFFQVNELEDSPGMVIPGPIDALHFVDRVLAKISTEAFAVNEIWASFSTEVISPEITDEQDIFGRNLFHHVGPETFPISLSHEVFRFYLDVVHFLCHEPLSIVQEDDDYQDRFTGLSRISNEKLVDHTFTEFGVRGQLPRSLDESAFSEAASESFADLEPHPPLDAPPPGQNADLSEQVLPD